MGAQKKVKKIFKKEELMAIAAFDVTTSGEIIQIIRVADNYAWRWNRKEDNKSYGSYVVNPAYKNVKLEKQIKEMMAEIDTMKDGVKKTRAIGRLNELNKFYDDLKVEDTSNLLGVLIQQADLTIDEVKAKK